MIRSTFASFTTAQSAIAANQNALAIVGQNMANVKTEGYTRQRLDQYSRNLKNVSSMYPDRGPHIGYGVEVTGVSQIRDPFLDARYRQEMGNLGSMDKRLSVLSSMNTILDEVDRPGIDDQMKDLYGQLNNLIGHAGDKSLDNMVRSSAQVVTDLFRQYSSKLSDVKENLASDTEADMESINTMLNKILELNKSIKSSQAQGNPSLELQDARNTLLDQLATYGNIKVTHHANLTMTGYDVDEMTVDWIQKDGTAINLIDDTRGVGSFSMSCDADGTYKIQIKDSMGIPSIADSDKGTLQTSMGMLNDSGEFDNPPTSNRGIGYYQKSLDLLAVSFAEKLNSLNTVDKDEDGNPLPPDEVKGGPLFSTQDGSPLSAANINISSGWLDGTVRILSSRGGDDPSLESSNIQNMLNALDEKLTFRASDDPDSPLIYQGTFQGCFTNMVGILGTDYQSTDTTLDNYLSVANDISESKESVSGVNLDEEGMNLLMLNNALNAASRLMTTLDEALNTIITSMGVVGR